MTHPVSPEVGKALADALREIRDSTHKNALTLRSIADRALARYDAEQGKAAEPVAWQYFDEGKWWPTHSIDKLPPHIPTRALFTGPAPSAVRAPAVVAAQGVTDYDMATLRHARTFLVSREKMHPVGIEQWDEMVERFAATRAQQGGDAGEDFKWPKFSPAGMLFFRTDARRWYVCTDRGWLKIDQSEDAALASQSAQEGTP